MWTCNRSALQTLGSQPIMMLKNLPGHWSGTVPRKFLGKVGQHPSDSKSNRLHVDIFRFRVRHNPKLLDDAREIPKTKEEVGGSITGCKISYRLGINLVRWGQLPHALWRWHVGLLSQKLKNKKKVYIFWFCFIHLTYVLYFPLKWLTILVKSWAPTSYFSNSTGSSITNRRFFPNSDLEQGFHILRY